MSEAPDREVLLRRLFGRTDVPSALVGPFLHTAEVAALFQVSERTVYSWARTGRIPSLLTPGGQRRYPADEIRKLLVDTRRAPSTPGPAAAPGTAGSTGANSTNGTTSTTEERTR